MSERFREWRTSPLGDYIEEWMVDPPAIGTTYRVIREHWEKEGDEERARH